MRGCMEARKKNSNTLKEPLNIEETHVTGQSLSRPLSFFRSFRVRPQKFLGRMQRPAKPKLSYSKICELARTHCRRIESYRGSSITPEVRYNTGHNSSSSNNIGDCFVVLKNPACRFGTVSIDHAALSQLDSGVRWIVLYLHDALYMVERTDCEAAATTVSPTLARQHRKIVDGFLLLELKELIHLPMSALEGDDDNDSREMDRLANSLSDSVIIDTRRERHPYAQNHHQTHRYDDLVMEKTALKYQTRTLVPYTLFSLPTYLMHEGDGRLGSSLNSNDPDDDYVRRDTVSEYMHYIYDYALIYSHFKNADHRVLLENKLLAYYNTHAGREATHHGDLPHSLMVHCMLNMAHCESPDTQPSMAFDKSATVRHVSLQDVQCRALEECVAWELFKLRRVSQPIQSSKFADLVQQHRRYMCEMRQVYDVPLPAWLAYTLTSDTTGQQVLWIATPLNSSSNNNSAQRESDSTYAGAFEWGPLLYDMAGSNQVATPINATGSMAATGLGITFINGRITLSYTVFRDVFLPLLYRQTLLDSFRLAVVLRCQIAPHLTRPIFKSWRMYGWFHEEVYAQLPTGLCSPSNGGSTGSTQQWMSRDSSFQATSGRGYANDMYQYCLEHHDLGMPVMRKLARRDNYMQLDEDPSLKQQQQQQQKTNSATAMCAVSRLADIEDLGGSLPKCIAGILARDQHLQNRDRLSAVSYLIDMDYTLEQIVTHLHANKREEIVALYKSLMLKKRKAHGAPVSLNCNGKLRLDV